MVYDSVISQPFINLKMSTMKKVVFLFFCCLFGLSAVYAAEPDYVVSEGKLYVVETLRANTLFGFYGKNDDGRVRFSASEVESYRKNGEVFFKMPEVVDNKPTGREVFMQGLATRNGYVIYRHSVMADRRTPVDNYYVYKGKDYVLQLDQSTSKQLSHYFNYGDK
jgi:hypothetical protein